MRSWRTLGLLLIALSGCDALTKGEFVGAYTNALCEHELMCGDQALMTYEGILTVEDCVEVRAHDVGVWGQGCRFRAKDAEACLADMEALTCPPAVGSLADRPVSCETVYFDCDPTESTTPDPTPEESDVAAE